MKKILLAGLASLALAAPAAAADLAARPMYTKAPAVQQVFNWTGFYVGGYAGWMKGNSQDVSGSGPKVSLDGGVFGGLAGFNYQINQFVVGLEGDGGWSDASHGTDNNNFADFKTRFVGNLRARAGIAYDRVLFFVAGGATWADEKITHFGSSTVSETRSGWTLGGGVDWAVTNNFIARVEYLYADLGGNKAYPFFGGSDTHIVSYNQQNTVRAAAIWKF